LHVNTENKQVHENRDKIASNIFYYFISFLYNFPDPTHITAGARVLICELTKVFVHSFAGPFARIQEDLTKSDSKLFHPSSYFVP